MAFDYTKLLNLFTPGNKQLVESGIAAFDENQPIQRKPTGMLNDQATSDYISAKYPMKPEFNQDWALGLEKRRQQDRSFAPENDSMALSGGNDEPLPMNTNVQAIQDAVLRQPIVNTNVQNPQPDAPFNYTIQDDVPVTDTNIPVNQENEKLPLSSNLSNTQQIALSQQIPITGFNPELPNPTVYNPNQPITPNQPLPTVRKEVIEQPILDQPITPAQRRQQAEQGLYDATNKDYSKPVKDANGNVIKQGGKDRDKDKNWWDVVKSIGLGALRGYGAGGLGGMIGGAITGGVGGAVDRNFDEKLMDTMFRVPAAQMQVEQARQAEDYDTNQRVRQTQMDNMKTDNQNQAERLKETKRQNWYRTHKFFDPSTATEADRQQLAEFGETPETVGKYDFTNPVTRNIAGEEFERDPTDKSWKSTGLKDPSKAIVEYTVQDPDNPLETTTYKVSSDRAAAFKTSITNAKLNIIAQKIAANANREQQTRIFNAKGQFEADQENIKNDVEYNKQVIARMDKLNAASGNSTIITAELTKANNKLANIYAQMKAMESKPDIVSSDGTKAYSYIDINADDYNKLQNEYTKAQAEYDATVGKYTAANDAITSLENEDKIKRPARLQFKPIQAVQVPTNSGGGNTSKGKEYDGMVFQSPESLQSQFPGWKPEQIREFIKARGGIFQK